MKLKSSMALVGMGAAGVLLYQNIKNGNMKKMESKMEKAIKKEISYVEELM